MEGDFPSIRSLVEHIFGNCAEAIILGNGGEKVLAVVLSQGLVIPHDAFLHIAAVQSGLVPEPL